jgi:hypothetical protein
VISFHGHKTSCQEKNKMINKNLDMWLFCGWLCDSFMSSSAWWCFPLVTTCTVHTIKSCWSISTIKKAQSYIGLKKISWILSLKECDKQERTLEVVLIFANNFGVECFHFQTIIIVTDTWQMTIFRRQVGKESRKTFLVRWQQTSNLHLLD